MAKSKVTNIDDYISMFPDEVQTRLRQLRDTVKKAAPGAEETISYQIPTFVLNGNLVHFAAFRNHIGFYPTPGGIKEFEKDLARFKGAKGSVQFPLDQPLPLSLVTKIVKFRVKENLKKKPARKAAK